MRYEKPVVMDLSARARTTGQGPLGCVTGQAASGWESCGSGSSAQRSCITGDAGGGYTSCMSGSAADYNGDCLNGTVVAYYCEAGTGGGNDPYGCNAGPVFIDG